VAVALGTAPDSWGVWFADDPAQPPWREFLDDVAAVGYRWIELGPLGYLPREPVQLRPELDERGLLITAGGVMFPLEDKAGLAHAASELEETCSLIAEFGGRYLLLIDDVYEDLRTGAPTASPALSEAGWAQLFESIEAAATVASEHGLTALLHPHAQTHVATEDEIERVLDAVGIGLCLDIGHHAYGGGEPVAFLGRHRERIPYLHLKNVDGSLLERVRSERWSFGRAVAAGVFVEPREGLVDFVALRDALTDNGYDGFCIVEQDMYPVSTAAALPIAKRTRSYLEEIGFGTASPSSVQDAKPPQMEGHVMREGA